MVIFWFWVFLLAALLFYPVTQLIWVLSVRRMQRKLKKELNDQELAAEKQRARFISVIACFFFSLLYNFVRLGPPAGG